MDKKVAILIVLFVTAICGVKKECPPWFEWVNTSDFSTGYCACSAVLYIEIRYTRNRISYKAPVLSTMLSSGRLVPVSVPRQNAAR